MQTTRLSTPEGRGRRQSPTLHDSRTGRLFNSGSWRQPVAAAATCKAKNTIKKASEPQATRETEQTEQPETIE